MMQLTQQTFLRNWKKIYPYNDNRSVLLAVSGGSDSMVMAELFRSSAIPFAVGHCNFQLRAEASMLDEALVKEWCEQYHIPFHTIRFETEAAMAEQKKGVQEVARSLRYEWLEGIRQSHNYAMIATAHHANDNVETLLMNLCKGTGISGLHGIPTINKHIIRPLLFAEKNSILEYSKQNSILYRDDASNATDKYKRNEIRHHLVPVVEQVFPNAVQQINESIERFAGAELIYKEAVEKMIAKLTEQRGNDIYIPIIKLLKTSSPETICYELFTTYGFSSAQMPQLLQLTIAETGHYVSSGTHRVIRHRDFLVIAKEVARETEIIIIDTIPTEIITATHDIQFSEVDIPATLPTEASHAYVDLSKITLPLMLRKWRTGDYFYPIGMGMKKKKLSKLFIDQKLSIAEKERVWVLETADKKIVWVVGMRLDERFKLKARSTLALKIACKPIEDNTL